MKKALAIALALTYLFISSGVVVSVHYCMGEVADVAIGHSNTDTCGTCGMDNSDCCHDDVSIVKIQDSHSMASAQADFVKAEAIAQQFSPAVHTMSRSSRIAAGIYHHRPPPSDQQPLHIRYCVFRI